mgnify:CR=1 FL=1
MATTKVTIYFTEKVFEELKAYIIQKYGVKKALSITVQQAVREFLERQRLLKQLNDIYCRLAAERTWPDKVIALYHGNKEALEKEKA